EQLPSGDFAVDSFFDVSYRIEFTGAPGGTLDGLSGTSTGTVTIQQGDAFRDYFFGLPHKALGSASLSGTGDHLVVSNIGSSGEDGVSIDVGVTCGFGFEVDFGQAGALLPGSIFSVHDGTVNLSDDILFTITETNSGQGALSFGHGLGGNFECYIFLNGVVVDSNTFTSPLPDPLIVGDIGSSGPNGVKFICHVPPGNPGNTHTIQGCGSDYPPNMNPIKRTLTITLPAPTTLTLDGNTPVIGDQIQLKPKPGPKELPGNGWPVFGLFSIGSQVKLRAANTGDITIKDEAIIEFGAAHRPLGQAKIFCDSGWAGNGCTCTLGYYCGSGLTIYNIGSSGEDGVSIDLPNDIAKEHIYIADLGDANSLTDGSFIEVTAKGELNSVPDQNVSIVRHQDIGSKILTSIEFLVPVESNSLGVEYFLDGQLVAAEPNISPLSSWLGWRMPTDFEISWNKIRREYDFGWTYPPEKDNRIMLLAGGEISVDEVRVSGKTTETFGGYSNMELRAADIPALTLTCEKTTYAPACGDADHLYPEGDVNQDCHVNFLDLSKLALNWLVCNHPDGCL
ncbi:MAG: hypothetical protein ACYSU8_07685, partial [Planctomycetota bacterium]